MADTKISDLTADTSPSTDDLVVTVDSPGSSPVNKKVTIANLLALQTMVLISSNTLGADASSVSFTSIPATYTHLKIIYIARTTEATTDDYLLMQFNGDSAANYDFTQIRAINTTLSGSSQYAQTAARIADMVGASASSSAQVTPGEVTIPYYALTTFNKSYFGINGAVYGTSGSNADVYGNAGQWRSTAAITRVDFLPSANNLKAGSSFSLYGIR